MSYDELSSFTALRLAVRYPKLRAASLGDKLNQVMMLG